MGKTRTLEWARVRAHATYGHRVLVLDSAEDPAASLLRQHWRLDGLESEAMAERIERLNPFADAHTRSGWLRLVEEREPVEPAYADSLLGKALEAAPPLLVIVDHPSVVSRLSSLIGEGRGMGWLVAIRRPQDLPVGFPHARLGRLADSSIRRIVGSIVRADRLFVQQVCQRSRGNPGVALQLLRLLFDTGALRATRTGFSVAEGTALPAPGTAIYAEEAARLRRVVSEHAFRGLVAGAATADLEGEGVWEKVCDGLGVDACLAEVRELEQRGWVQRHRNGWRFSSDLLVDALLEEAIWDGTADAVHRAVLDHLNAERPHDLIERSRHTAAIQDWSTTYDLAFQAIWGCFFRGAYNVGPLLDRLDLASEMLGTPSKRSEALRARAVSDRLHGHPDRAHRRLDQAETIEGLSVDATALLVLERGQLERSAGRHRQAQERFERARQLAVSARVRAEAELSLGEVLMAQGDADGAHTAFQRTSSTPEARPIDHAYAAFFLAQSAQGTDAFDEQAREALRVAKSAGFLDVVAQVEMLRGDQALHDGDPALAGACYTRAFRQAETLGSELMTWCAISMAVVGWKRRDLEQLRHWLAVVGQPPGPGFEVFVSLLGAFHYLVEGRDAPALREAERLLELVREHGVFHPILVEIASDAQALAVGLPAAVPLSDVMGIWEAPTEVN